MHSDFQLGAWRVQPQLNSVACDHRTIRIEPKMMGVLVCLAHRPGEVVSKEQLVGEVWRDTFVTDDVLVRCVSGLRRVFGDDAGRPGVIETIPKKGYRLLLPVVSLERAEELQGRLQPDFADSIAVLPFENGGADPEMDYLSDGIAETIINSLSRLRDLRVVPRTTAFRYKRKLLDPAEVGRELGARIVLTGHVIQRGDRLVVGVELIDAVQCSQIWGRTYAHKMEDIFSIQDEIAAEIPNYLRLRLTDAEKRRLSERSTKSLEAYHLYLKAMYFANKWTPGGIRKGFEYCSQAIEVDPVYAAAYTCLAYLYLLIGFLGGAPPIDTFAKAKAAALKALEIDDGEADAHAALSFVRLVHDWDWEGSKAELRRTAELGPNLVAGHYVYSHWYLTRRQFPEAIAEAKVALSIDPLSLKLNYHLGVSYYFSRQCDEAIEQLLKTDELDPLFAATHQMLASAYARMGRCHCAMAEAEKGLALSGGSPRGKALWGVVCALLGKRAEAREVLDLLRQESIPPHFFHAYACAGIYALLGEPDQAFEWLDKACEGRAGALVYLGADPRLEILHEDPRFDELLRRIGLPS